MNIKNARQQMIDTIRAYLAKDENGQSLIPFHKQRPLFLVGPPGIGKTEIMSQIAGELGIGLLSYSMTHHTRQSAIGLPVIKTGEYKGESFEVTEYTMSEILSSVYEMMSETGVENGILFLDEINCISETLMPIMLQFLQYKVFGGHRLPEGWVVVTAGNPPEYNSSVREFDVATCDRLKMLEISPDLEAWKEYAYSRGVHGAVVSFLDIKPRNFYKIERSAGAKSYVTARGWDDLSRILIAYEKLGLTVDKELVGQYIRIQRIAEDFFLYYELYNKYKREYRIDGILEGTAGEETLRRAKDAAFDERYSLLGLVLDELRAHTDRVLFRDELMGKLKNDLKRVKGSEDSPADTLGVIIGEVREEQEKLERSGRLSEHTAALGAARVKELEGMRSLDKGYPGARDRYMAMVEEHKKAVATVKGYYSNMFRFCEEAFGEGQEMLILLTELAASPGCAGFISAYGCDEYYKYDTALMFYERRLDLIDRIEGLSDQEGAGDS